MSSCCNVCLEKDDIKTVLFSDLDDTLCRSFYMDDMLQDPKQMCQTPKRVSI